MDDDMIDDAPENMSEDTTDDATDDITDEMTIVDALFVQRPYFIVLVSGVLPDLEQVVEDVAKDLGFTFLCFSHIKTNYNPVNKRVDQLLEKKHQGLILCGTNFPSDKLGFKVGFHIHLSVNKTLFVETESKAFPSYEDYKQALESNFINKYINVKPGYEVKSVADQVFDLVINQIDSIVHHRKK